MLLKVSQSVSAPLLRCVSKETYSKERDYWCQPSAVIDYNNTSSNIEDLRLSSIKDKDPIQVQPQKIKLILRPGERKISSRLTIFIH